MTSVKDYLVYLSDGSRRSQALQSLASVQEQPQVCESLHSPSLLSIFRSLMCDRNQGRSCNIRTPDFTKRRVGLSRAWQVESAIPAGINFLTVPDNTPIQPQCCRDIELQTPRDAGGLTDAEAKLLMPRGSGYQSFLVFTRSSLAEP